MVLSKDSKGRKGKGKHKDAKKDGRKGHKDKR